jgi:hypothetical protein
VDRISNLLLLFLATALSLFAALVWHHIQCERHFSSLREADAATTAGLTYQGMEISTMAGIIRRRWGERGGERE